MATNQDFNDLIDRIETATETLESDVALVGNATEDMQQAVEDAQGYAQDAAQSLSDAEDAALAAANSAQQAGGYVSTIEGMITDLENAVVLEEAPEDGQQYARQNGGWSVVVGGDGGSVDWDDVTNKPSFGTAAEADLTTSLLDTTVGNVLKVGDFGIGVGMPSSGTGVDYNDYTTPGVYLISGLNSGGNPPIPSRPALLTVKAGSVSGTNNRVIQTAETYVTSLTEPTRSFTRVYSGSAWGDWQELFTTGSVIPVTSGGTNADNASDARTNLGLGTAATATLTTSTSDITEGRVLKVGDFNLGVSPLIESDVDLNTKTTFGHYMVSATGLVNAPVAGMNGLLVVYPARAGFSVYAVLQEYTGYSGATMGRKFQRWRSNNTSWTPWVEIHTTESLSVVTSNGDTTSTRIPTVGWVQANAGGGAPGVIGGGTTAQYAAQTFIYDVATMENRAANSSDTVFADAVDIFNNFGRRFPVFIKNNNDATNGPTPWYEDGINPFFNVQGIMEIVPTYNNELLGTVTNIYVYLTIHFRSTTQASYGKRYMRRMRETGAWREANWTLIPAT